MPDRSASRRSRCPACAAALDLTEPGGPLGPAVRCAACGRDVRARPLAILDAVATEHARRRGRSRAGPPGAPLGRPPPLAALLEDVRSLWNVGSMFRTADGAGIAELYLCGITGCPPDPALAKTSLGADDAVRWEHYAGALDVLPELVRAGVQLVALEKTPASEPLTDCLKAGRLRAPLCLLVGNENEGLSPEALASAGLICHLPMRGVKTSLNAAVAFGVAAYTIAEAL